MKKTIISCIAILLALSSCQNEDRSDNSDTFPEKKSDNVIKIYSEGNENLMDLIYKRKNRLKAANFVKETIWTDGKGKTTYYEADQFVITSNMKNYIYPGSVLSGVAFEKGVYKRLGVRVDPIQVSTSMPGWNVIAQIDVPSYAATRQAASNFLRNNGVAGIESLSFSFNMSSFSYFNQLKVAFSSNINVAGVFNLSTEYSNEKIKHKTAMITRFEQEYYDITADFPLDGSILKNEKDLSQIKAEKPFWVTSIVYGRIGIMSIESNYEYSKVYSAVRAALTAKVINGNLNLTYEQQTILNEAVIKLYFIGGEGSYKVVEGIGEFQKFIVEKGVYSADAPGYPISFTASMVEDNSTFYSKFSIDMRY